MYHAFELFINYAHWLDLVDSAATGSTNISNYFCTLWPNYQRFELCTNIVSQSSLTFQIFLFLTFTSCFQYYLAGHNPHFKGELTDWHSSGLKGFSVGILISHSQISIWQITDFYFANHYHISISQITNFYFANHK